MFCKWCGEPIEAMDTRCSLCGRETPPVSDYGGFFDCGNEPKKETEKETHSISVPVHAASPVRTDDARRRKELALRNRVHHTTMICCFVIVLAFALLFSIITWIQLGNLKKQVCNGQCSCTEPTSETTEQTDILDEEKDGLNNFAGGVIPDSSRKNP